MIGTDGVRITIDADITIPGGTLATNGSATVSAHAYVTGASGNIRAGDINGPCCQDYVFAYNSAFSGGQDAHSYRTASAADIAAAGKDLSSLITTQLVDAAEQQLSATEAMSQPDCKVTTTSAPKPGIAATQVTVSVTSISRTSFAGGTLTASLTLMGDVVYRFRSDEIQSMQQMIAGKSRVQATTLLLHTRGVHTVGIQVSNGKDKLPGNQSSVFIDVFDKG